MIAYKATYDMKCRNKTYKVGKTYRMYGKIKVCKRGFHFCRDAKDTLNFYNYNSHFELMEIEVLGKIIDHFDYHDGRIRKSVTNKFKVIKVVSRKDYQKHLGFTLDEDYNLIKQDTNYCTYHYKDGLLMDMVLK